MLPRVQRTARVVLLAAVLGATVAGATLTLATSSLAMTSKSDLTRSRAGTPLSACGTPAAVLADPMAGCEDIKPGQQSAQQDSTQQDDSRLSSDARARPGGSGPRALMPGFPELGSPIALSSATALTRAASNTPTSRPGVGTRTPATSRASGSTPRTAAASYGVDAQRVMADMRLLSTPQRGTTRAARPLPVRVLSTRTSPGMGIRSLFCLAIGALMAGAAALMAAGRCLRDVRR